MLFNSTVFLQFFAAFLLLYFLCRNSLTARNILIVAASYWFYGWWDPRFLILLAFSSGFDYSVGLLLEQAATPGRRKAILSLSIICNLTLLGFFKYYDFFIGSFAALLTQLHVAFHPHTLGIVLPVGISFYTFQSMSYVLDVYRREMKPTRNLLSFLAYVSFFPQLVAGPIGRGHHLLPQFETPRVITRAMLAEGLWLVLWGLFKKVALADNFAPLVAMVFDHPQPSAPMVVLGTLAFGLQIYSDFSGYSDIARGTAKILGFDLIFNFNLPYVAVDIRDFWRRWHISLSTWLRDYLYFSLGGNRRGSVRTYLNLLITMLLGGLWHGAAWNFVLWGLWHGIGLMAHRWWCEQKRFKFTLPNGLAWGLTMLFVFYGWMLFRANSWEQIWGLTRGLGDWQWPAWLPYYLLNLGILALPLIGIGCWQKRSGNLLVPLQAAPWTRHLLQGFLLLGIIMFWGKATAPFIYFQF